MSCSYNVPACFLLPNNQSIDLNKLGEMISEERILIKFQTNVINVSLADKLVFVSLLKLVCTNRMRWEQMSS